MRDRWPQLLEVPNWVREQYATGAVSPLREDESVHLLSSAPTKAQTEYAAIIATGRSTYASAVGSASQRNAVKPVTSEILSLLEWMTDRLVYQYNESENLDYIRKAREMTKTATCTYFVGEGEEPVMCGHRAVAQVKYLTDEWKRFGTILYCAKHFETLSNRPAWWPEGQILEGQEVTYFDGEEE